MRATHRITWPGGEMTFERARVMGVLNLTPDSFSDGGLFDSPEKAMDRAWRIVREGADILDIGAESTRPGAESVGEEEERLRLWPVLRDLKNQCYPLPISLDTTKPALADAALGEGWVQMVNDVQGLRCADMVQVVKRHQVPVIVMHMFGTPRTMQSEYNYDDVVQDLIGFFRQRLQETGLKENILLDPGIGFGKSIEDNLSILARLTEFLALGHPVLIGASRKSFMGKILDLPVEERLEGSLAVAAVSVFQGASVIRVHDVQASVRTTRMVEAIRGMSR